ncbi:hypothetical protein SAMN02745220_05170 [Desulfopila aestuarii DSM 18488]|uniref:Uncharacterized protein n=1 Tax=Desulfopila aestuarii DSM 18488 TaxID=1121416 RepID=A0A1M7YLK5_9BACT|nr:hypothetical protein SAMN02745220_05170 [Desulfopila aestuarii DSM 18488]
MSNNNCPSCFPILQEAETTEEPELKYAEMYGVREFHVPHNLSAVF